MEYHLKEELSQYSADAEILMRNVINGENKNE